MSDTDSLFKVPLTTISKILPHPNADKLEIAVVYGFHVVVQKDRYKVGSVVLYIPVDSILPYDIEKKLFPPDAKIKLHNNRVRQIRIRAYASQGMLVNPSDLGLLYNEKDLEVDYSEMLEITKYEPPIRGASMAGKGKKDRKNKKYENPHFRKFNGITNLKWMPSRFEGEEVVIQEKIHGSHVRFGKAPYVANTLWKKVKKLFGFTPAYEFVYGSNNVELSAKSTYSGFYEEDVYSKMVHKYGVENKVHDGEFVHGEIYGPGIQKNYVYGTDEHKLIIFDVRIMNKDGTQRWLNPDEAELWAKLRGFDFVPVLYKGMFSEEKLKELTSGPSVLCPEQKVREGVVVKSAHAYDIEQNKQALKSINPDYLDDKSNTDFN